ncbi:MAG: AAA family ATPase [Umezawaea sp.]
MSERHCRSVISDGQRPGHPIAPPKLRVPPGEAPMVDRERLSRLLDEHTSTTSTVPPVTVVTGPAGAGKTTALAAWARRRAAQPSSGGVGWVTLDVHDNTPAYLWSAVREALVIGIHAREDAPELPPPEIALEPEFPALVIAALDRMMSPVCLVVDDVHLLHDRAALRGLEMLVRHPPRSLRLVLAGRHVPPLHLSRLRLEGRLRVVDERDLAFTRDEAEALFISHALRLTPEDVDHVLRRTEGWTAGLRLAALSLAPGSPEPVRPAAFSGALPAVADYLTEEILNQRGEQVRRLLTATSVCDVVSGDLAAAVAEEPEAGRMLQDLHRTNALVSASDTAEGWFRYHPLLRDHLSDELDRTRPRDRASLHQAAALWFRDNGQADSAIEHAVHADRLDLAADLVDTHGVREILCGNGDRLYELLKPLSQHMAAQPVMALVGALAALEAGDVSTADWLLKHVDDKARTVRSEWIRALNATTRLRRARSHGRLEPALRALSAIPAGGTGDPALDVLVWAERGVAELWRGHLDRAAEELGQALEAAEREGFHYAALGCLVHLAAVAAAQGDSIAMAEYAARALELATGHGWERRPVCALLYAVLAADSHRRLDDAPARHMAGLAVGVLGDRQDRTVELIVAAVDAITAFDQADDPHAVVSALRKQWLRFADGHVAPHVAAEVVPTAQRMALRVGEPQWAADMAAQLEALLGPSAENAMAQAIVLSHRGRAAQARKVVEPVLRGEVRSVVPCTRVDAWLLEATVLDREGNAQQAHEAVRKALSVAEPRQALRPFVNAGKPVRDLLARGAGRFGRLDRFATTVMTTVPTAVGNEPESLTTRERALLVELPSMRTAEEIAGSMYVSVNTVKTHLRGIYRKLGVSQRRDAVVVARQRGLI